MIKKLSYSPGKAINHSNEFRNTEFIGADILKHISFHSNEVDARGSLTASQSKKRQGRRRDTNRNKRWEPYNEDRATLTYDLSHLVEQFSDALFQAAEKIERSLKDTLNEYPHKQQGMYDRLEQKPRDLNGERVTPNHSPAASKYAEKASRVSPMVSSNKDITNIPYQGDPIKPIKIETEKISADMERFIEERIANAFNYRLKF